MTDFSRHEFSTIDELHAAVKANQHKQTFRYYLNIELGYYLVNTETSKRHFFIWSFVSRIKRISTIIQQNTSTGNTPCVIYLSIYEWLPDVCILWITLDSNSQRMYKMASLAGQWRSKNTVHRWLFIKPILERNFAAISWNNWHRRQLNHLTRELSFDWRWWRKGRQFFSIMTFLALYHRTNTNLRAA